MFTSTGHEPKTRKAIKDAFRLAINQSKTRTEARRIDRLRGRYFAGTLTSTEAMIAWLDLKLGATEAGNPRVWAP
jgi:hypothetical protein